jgi:hypothetical protein
VTAVDRSVDIKILETAPGLVTDRKEVSGHEIVPMIGRLAFHNREGLTVKRAGTAWEEDVGKELDSPIRIRQSQ